MCSVCAWPQSYDHRPSQPYYARTEHVGFSPTRQTLVAPRAKRREVLGESHEGSTASFQEPLVRRTSAPCAYFVAYGTTAPMSYSVFWCGHSGDSNRYYYVTASWACLTIFTLRDAIIALAEYGEGRGGGGGHTCLLLALVI